MQPLLWSPRRLATQETQQWRLRPPDWLESLASLERFLSDSCPWNSGSTVRPLGQRPRQRVVPSQESGAKSWYLPHPVITRGDSSRSWPAPLAAHKCTVPHGDCGQFQAASRATVWGQQGWCVGRPLSSPVLYRIDLIPSAPNVGIEPRDRRGAGPARERRA